MLPVGAAQFCCSLSGSDQATLPVFPPAAPLTLQVSFIEPAVIYCTGVFPSGCCNQAQRQRQVKAAGQSVSVSECTEPRAPLMGGRYRKRPSFTAELQTFFRSFFLFIPALFFSPSRWQFVFLQRKKKSEEQRHRLMLRGVAIRAATEAAV